MTDGDDPRANATLLVLEIGTSHVSVATSIDGRIFTNERFEHGRLDEVAQHAREAWAGLPENRARAVVAGSVVPSILEAVRRRVSTALDQPVRVVGEDLHRPLSLAVEAPERVGIDRICAAAAAYETLEHACAVASFGTAITIDCVNNEGAFMGGAILPGLELQAQSLAEGAAQLPRVEIDSPAGTYGASTEEAICTGVLFGVVGGLREIIERFATELGGWPDLVATGGNAELIGKHSDIIDRVVPDLCIRGIALAYRKHFLPFEGTE